MEIEVWAGMVSKFLSEKTSMMMKLFRNLFLKHFALAFRASANANSCALFEVFRNWEHDCLLGP